MTETRGTITSATRKKIEVSTFRDVNHPRYMSVILSTIKRNADGQFVATTISLNDKERRDLIKLLSGKEVE